MTLAYPFANVTGRTRPNRLPAGTSISTAARKPPPVYLQTE